MALAFKDNGDSTVQWPWTSMLLLGTFGRHTSGSRRYHVRTVIALAVLTAGMLLAPGVGATLDPRHARWIPALLFGTTFSVIAYELWRYVAGLDELSRTLQLEAMAITYLIGLPLFMTSHGISMAVSWSWHLPALAYLALDLLRGLVVVLLARRYR